MRHRWIETYNWEIISVLSFSTSIGQEKIHIRNEMLYLCEFYKFADREKLLLDVLYFTPERKYLDCQNRWVNIHMSKDWEI